MYYIFRSFYSIVQLLLWLHVLQTLRRNVNFSSIERSFSSFFCNVHILHSGNLEKIFLFILSPLS